MVGYACGKLLCMQQTLHWTAHELLSTDQPQVLPCYACTCKVHELLLDALGFVIYAATVPNTTHLLSPTLVLDTFL